MCYYIIRTSKGVRDAAIAQQVERILGKDEVTSSNLVSSLAVRVRQHIYEFRGVAQFG